jgi:hypothetical protein
VLAKIATVILTIGIVGCILLTARQQRLQAVHDLAVLQRRVAEHDRTLWHLRAEIARNVQPRNVEALARALGPLEHIPIDPRPGAAPLQLAAADRPPPDAALPPPRGRPRP